MSRKEPTPMRDLEQGMYVVDDSVQEPNIDIVVVPGFGADTLNCWAWNPEKRNVGDRGKTMEDDHGSYGETRFNWVTSKLGLSATFKRARILRYAFASAWQGTYQIENFFDSIVRGLLLSLQANRTEPGEKGRPIIFIGHSMGGLVIAKALTEMDRLRKDFGELLPCVTSCVFFGTPFLGTGMASFFFDVVEMMRRHALKVNGAFWSMMRPESDSLQTLRHEVAQLAQRTEPNIELRYVFEQLQFDEREMFPEVSSVNMFERKMDGSFLSFLAGLDETTSLELHKRLKGYLENDKGLFVSCASATMGSEKGLGLQFNHRQLVTFKHANDGKYKAVLAELRPLVDNSEAACRKRLVASSRQCMSSQMVGDLMNTLDSGLWYKHQAIVEAKKEKSWVLENEHYQRWERSRSTSPFFWIVGRPGVGKTSATLSAISSIYHKIRLSSGTGKSLLGFFLCESSGYGSSSIELLKSLVFQFIKQNQLLATYAKHLPKKRQPESTPSADKSLDDDSTATMSLHNLWRCFIDKHPKIDLDAANPRGSPPLALAAGMSPEDVFRRILIGGKAKWTVQNHGQALKEACYSNKPGNIRALLDHAGESFDDAALRSAIFAAAIGDSWDCVLAISRPDLGGSNVFYLAAVTMRDGNSAKTVLEQTWSNSPSTVELDVRNAALYQATDNQKAQTVAWLLKDCKADANATDHRPRSLDPNCFTDIPSFGNALAAAAWDGTIDIVKMLLEHGAQIDSPYGCPLQQAAKGGHAEVVGHLLDHGAKIDRIPGENGDYFKGPGFPEGTALQAACESGRTDVVKVLLDWNANPNLGRGSYTSPIIAATKKDLPEILKLLLAAPELVVNTTGANDLATPLSNTVSHMSYEATELLLDAGANVNQSSPDGATALILAARKGDAKVLQLLIDRGADVLHEGTDKKTALDVAADEGHIDCLQVLVGSLSPLFRGLKKAIANGSTFARDLVARPGDDHDIIDMLDVKQLREQRASLTREVEDLHSIRLGWDDMMSRVQAAETNAAGYRQRMEQMQHERDSESAKTREELGKYQAAIHGFSKLQEEHESLRQSFAACEQSLTTQEENFRSEAQKLQKELDRLRSSSRDAEMRRQVAMDNAAKAKRRLQTAEEDVAKMQAEITLLQQQPRDSEQRFERQSIQSSGRDDGSHKEGTDFLGMNAGRLGISNTLASLNDINMAKGAKKLKNMGNNVKANMADMLPKKMGGS